MSSDQLDLDGLEVGQVLLRIEVAIEAIDDDAPDETLVPLQAGDVAMLLEIGADLITRLRAAEAATAAAVGALRAADDAIDAAKDTPQ